MEVFPKEINELDEAVIEKLKATHGSQAYSTWKLADYKMEEGKLSEGSLWSTYWFKYQDKDGRDHELRVEIQTTPGELHPYPEKGWIRRWNERPTRELEIFDWNTGERLA
jgi:hypothetical protein